MTVKPRIFVSAVTSEFGTARRRISDVLRRLGYDAVLQDIFGTEAGDLRQVLRDKIDSCDGLIQLTGDAYGAEPPAADEQFGRVSYTQFEYLYAHQQGKKTWQLIAGEGCRRDRAFDQQDLPLDADHPDPLAWQSQRRDLQTAYRRKLRAAGDLWYDVRDEYELEIKLRDLKDEYAGLRKSFRRWQKLVAGLIGAVLFGVLVIVGSGLWNANRTGNKERWEGYWKEISTPLRSRHEGGSSYLNRDQVKSILDKLGETGDEEVDSSVKSLLAWTEREVDEQAVYNFQPDSEFRAEFDRVKRRIWSTCSGYSGDASASLQAKWLVNVYPIEMGATPGEPIVGDFRGPADELTHKGISQWLANTIFEKYNPDYEQISVVIRMPGELLEDEDEALNDQITFDATPAGSLDLERGNFRWHVWIPWQGGKDHRLVRTPAEFNEMRRDGSCFMHIDRPGYKIRIAEIPPYGTDMNEVVELKPWSVRIALEGNAAVLAENLKAYTRKSRNTDEPESTKLFRIVATDKITDLKSALASGLNTINDKEQVINRDRVDFKVILTKEEFREEME